MSHGYESGFSAIELLITIFVAVAFLASGYQLYSAVVRNGADTRNQTTASNIAYDYLRRVSPQATNPCTVIPNSTLAPTIPSGTTLPAATITANITCPFGATSGTSLVTVVVGYGNTNPKQVQHAIFVTN